MDWQYLVRVRVRFACPCGKTDEAEIKEVECDSVEDAARTQGKAWYWFEDDPNRTIENVQVLRRSVGDWQEWSTT